MECDVLTVSNNIIKNMVKMAQIFSDNRILVSIENPRTSVLWYFPDLIDMFEAHI